MPKYEVANTREMFDPIGCSKFRSLSIVLYEIIYVSSSFYHAFVSIFCIAGICKQKFQRNIDHGVT